MHLGASLLMITIGAIITFALRFNPRSVDLDAVGWIFMLVGVGGLIANHFVWERRKQAGSMTGSVTGSAGEAYGDHYVDEPYTLSYPDPALDQGNQVNPKPVLDPRYAQDPRVND